MKHIHLLLLLSCALLTICCRKEQRVSATSSASIPASILTRIKTLGFDTRDIRRFGDGYLVEGDILLHENDLKQTSGNISLNIGKTEQYHTLKLVERLPRTVTIRIGSTVPGRIGLAVNEAIKSFNGLGLRLKFQLVDSGEDIYITGVCYPSEIWSATSGFPFNGNPYHTIQVNTCRSVFADPCASKKIMEHEIGHCIGFRHTDLMNAAYSCGGYQPGEGAAGVGAVYIPGTPSGPNPGSFMLRCYSTICNKNSFNVHDTVALRYLYGN